jgi:hypothetical protein
VKPFVLEKNIKEMKNLVPRTQLQSNTLPNGGCCSIGSWLAPFFCTKLGPFLPFCDGVVDDGFLQGPFDFASNLSESVTATHLM